MIVATLNSGTTTAAIDESNNYHKVAITLSGMWNGATVVVQCQPYHNADWINITDASWTADATAVLDVSEEWNLRFSISDGGGSEDVEVTAQKMGA